MIQSAPINVSSIGDHQIIAGSSGRAIRVLSFLLASFGNVNVKWRSGAGKGATDLSGPIPLLAREVVPSPPAAPTPTADAGQFECAGGQDLTLNLSADVQVGGYVTYLVFPA